MSVSPWLSVVIWLALLVLGAVLVWIVEWVIE
jgi:hypothetical protein